jgi:tRNA1Val (adenine37-N6)-methyltransferase
MEQFVNGLTLTLPEGAFPLSTDSMVLGDFVKLRANATVLDLGSGGGTLGILLCGQDRRCTVTGVELDEQAHLAALENIRRNGLEHRLHSICADLRTVNRLFEAGSFQYCVSNPPYFTGGPASRTPLARRDDCCSPEQLFEAAARVLCYGGDFYLVHKPERLGQLCGCAVKAGLEPKRLKLVRHRTDGPVALVLLQCRKGAKPGLILEEMALHHSDGRPTEDYRRIYHLQEEQL